MTKQLEENSKYEKLDTNGDGIVSDKEFDMKEKLILLENRDKKEDQQRYLVWFSALSVTIFIVVLMTPLLPTERIDHLSGIAEIWVLSNMGIIGSFIGFNQMAKKDIK
jgi:nicotinamide riboside transporter PnuC|tara:strand:+ start:635 stop:958 length:324 start_codon:yes stop_codon:yes gene_type:complete